MSYIRNLLIAADQFGNALAGGNPDATVSGRVGFHASTAEGSQRLFWRSLAKAIDWALLPVDGPHHCWRVSLTEGEKYQPGNDKTRAVLAVLALPVCAVIGIALRVAAPFMGDSWPVEREY